MVETSTQSIDSTGDEINPIISGVLSLIIPGVGHFYHGQKERATKLLGVFALAFVGYMAIAAILPRLGFIGYLLLTAVSIGAAYDGYTQAGKINAGEIEV